MTTVRTVGVPRPGCVPSRSAERPPATCLPTAGRVPPLPPPVLGAGLSRLSLLPAVSPLAINVPWPLPLQRPLLFPARARVPLSLGSPSPSFHGASSPPCLSGQVSPSGFGSFAAAGPPSLTSERWLLNPWKPWLNLAERQALKQSMNFRWYFSHAFWV